MNLFQEVVGKYKDKVTKKDIADIWMNTYGEDIATDYDGFYNDLKENLEQVAKLEELDNEISNIVLTSFFDIPVSLDSSTIVSKYFVRNFFSELIIYSMIIATVPGSTASWSF